MEGLVVTFIPGLYLFSKLVSIIFPGLYNYAELLLTVVSIILLVLALVVVVKTLELSEGVTLKLSQISSFSEIDLKLDNVKSGLCRTCNN